MMNGSEFGGKVSNIPITVLHSIAQTNNNLAEIVKEI